MGAYDELIAASKSKKAKAPTTTATKAKKISKPTFQVGAKADLSGSAGLEQFAISKGLEPPKPSKFMSAVDKVSRALNIGTAVVAGGVRGAIRPDISISQGIAEGVKKNIGFGDIIREDLGIKPEDRFGKIAVGTVALAADIVFDPLTYLTFGTGAAVKVGGKTLSKPAQRVWMTALKESNQAKGLVNQIIQEASGKAGKRRVAEGFEAVSEKSLQAARAAGVSEQTLGSLTRLAGDKIFDKGGVKFMGKTIIGTQRLRSMPGIKQLADAAATSKRFQETKDTLGKLFVFNYGTNPKLQNILLAGGRKQQEAARFTVQGYEQLFKKHKLNDSELLEFALKGRESMKRVLEVEKKLISEGVEGARRIAKEQVAREGVQFSSPKLQSFFDDIAGEGGHMQQLQRLAGLSDEDAFKFYFPNIKKENVEAMFAAGRRGPKSAKKEYLKKFGGELTDEEVILDPFAAYPKRQIQVITERIDSETSRRIARGFGREFANDAAAKEAGYVAFKRKGIDGDIETYIPEQISKEVNAFFDKGTSTIDKLAKVTGFDWFTRLWKGYVTSLFPAFHIRNMTSNGFLNMTEFGMAAFNPKTGALAAQLAIGKGLKNRIMSKTGKYYTGEEVLKLAKKEGILDTGAFGAVEQLIEEAGERAIVGRRKGVAARAARQLGPEGAALRAGRKVGSTIEDQAKLVGFITALAQGHGSKEAAKRVRRAVFDYGRLTDFEKSVMRRLIPFYSFMRFNAEGQIRSLLKTPGRTAGQADLVRNIGQAFGEPLTEEDLEGIPPYALAGFGIKWGKDKDGKDRFITGFGLPIEAFLDSFSGEGNIMVNMMQDALNRLNPAVKLPAEVATGQDFFRGRPISEIYNAKDLVVFMDAMPKGAAKELKELLEWSEQKNVPVYENGVITGYTTKYTANPYMLHLFRNLPTSRVVQTASGLADEAKTPTQKALQYTTGVRVYVPDQEEQKFFNELNRVKELTAWLKRLGYAGEFTRAYEKKDAQVEVGGGEDAVAE